MSSVYIYSIDRPFIDSYTTTVIHTFYNSYDMYCKRQRKSYSKGEFNLALLSPIKNSVPLLSIDD